MQIQAQGAGFKIPVTILEKRLSTIGSGLAIGLSEQGNSTCVWTIEVFAKFEGQGVFRVGKFSTTAPAGGANPPSRIVGFASVPGDKGWFVQIEGDVVGSEADVYIDSSEVTGGTFGVTKNAAP